MRNLDLQNMFNDYRAPSDGSQELSLSRIALNPQQHRRFMAPEKLEDLIQSIRQHGVIQPLVVREMQNDTYQIIAGHRRFEAAKRVGLEAIPVVIRHDLNDQHAQAIALIENLQREDINAYEQVRGILDLLKLALKDSGVDISDSGLRTLVDRVSRTSERGDQGLSETTIARTKQIFSELGVGLSYFRKKCAVLDFPESLLTALQEGSITFAVARLLAGIEDRGKRARLLKLAKNGASVQDLASHMKQKPSPTTASTLPSRFGQIRRSFTKASPLIYKAEDADSKTKAELERLVASIETALQELEAVLTTKPKA